MEGIFHVGKFGNVRNSCYICTREKGLFLFNIFVVLNKIGTFYSIQVYFYDSKRDN